MRKIISVGIILLLLCSFIFNSNIIIINEAQSINQSSWSMYRGDAKRTGLSEYSLESNKGGLKWATSQKGLSFHSNSQSPAVDGNGTIYATSSGPYGLYAIDPDGDMKWFFNTNGNQIKCSTPAISNDGTIYQGAGNYLYAINQDGTKRWQFETNDFIWSSPGIDSEGTIYVGSFDTNLYAIYPNGSLKWSFPTDADIESSPAIDDDGTIYFVGHDEEYFLFALYPNGTKKWAFNIVKAGLMQSPVIGRSGTIYCYDLFDNLYAIHPNGTLYWKRPIQHGVNEGSTGDVWNMVIDPALGKDGTIYSGSLDSLYALNPDGSVKWRHVTDSEVGSPVVSDDGTIVIETMNEIRAIDSEGNRIWRSAPWVQDFDSVENQHIIGPEGTIYFMSGFGLYAVNGESTILGIRKTICYAIIIIIVVSILIVFLILVKKSKKGNYFLLKRKES